MPYTILVTGANKGIGYEAVKLLSQKKPEATILLGSRSTKNGEDAIAKMKSAIPSHPFSNVKTLAIDITDASSLSSAAEHIKSTYSTLDVLLHNSGISNLDGNPNHAAVFDVNVVGAKDTIETFTPLLTPKSGIVILVGSEVGSWYTAEANTKLAAELLDVSSVSWDKVEGWMKDWEVSAGGAEGKAKHDFIPVEQGMIGAKYCASKAIIHPWVRKYASTHPDVHVAVVCPGYCATELNNFNGPRSAEQGGESVIWPVLNEFESGRFYQDGIEKEFKVELPDWATGIKV